MSQDLLADIYNAFDPFKPLPAGSKQYVDCRSVRGDADVWRDLGKKIVRSQYHQACQNVGIDPERCRFMNRQQLEASSPH